MLYVPDATMDMVYINHYGYDLRQLDQELPPSVRSFDEKNFLQDPKHPNVPGFQMSMFHIRLGQYIDALAHLLSTGVCMCVFFIICLLCILLLLTCKERNELGQFNNIN